MSSEPTPSVASPDDEDHRQIILNAPKVIDVETSTGHLYATQPTVKCTVEIEAKLAEPELSSPEEIGTAALQKIIGTNKDEITGLSDTEFQKLGPDDRERLARAAVFASGIQLRKSESAVAALGQQILDSIKNAAQTKAEILNRAVQKNEILFGRKAAVGMLNSLEGMDSIGSALRSLAGDRLFDKGATAQLAETLRKSSSLQRLQEEVNKVGRIELPKIDFELDRQKYLERLPDVNLENLPAVRAARATEEARDSTQQVAKLMAAMTEQMSQLTKAVMFDAVPEFLKRIEEDRKRDAEERAHRVEEGKRAKKEERRGILKWQIALFVPLAAGAALTAWQLYINKTYKAENDTQQNRIEALLSQQVELSKANVALSKQLAEQNERRLQELQLQTRQQLVATTPAKAEAASKPANVAPQGTPSGSNSSSVEHAPSVPK